jgi:uncharacterized protein YbjT (DUF2867 family)
MVETSYVAVTGVSGFSGKYITRRLLASGMRVIGLTGHPDRSTEFGDQISCVPYTFHDSQELARVLSGVDVLINTYWVRYEHAGITFEQAIANSRVLIEAAVSAGVRRVVHVSVTNPSEDSPLPYFRGKALVERIIRESCASYAILRPAMLFGCEGVLINNIAWFLRHLPIFGIPGDGNYQIQPVYVDDLAGLAVVNVTQDENVVIDAVGPEIFSLNELVRLIRDVVGARTVVTHIPATFALTAVGVLNRIVKDVVMTPDEITGLQQGLLVTHSEPTGSTKLSEWLRENADLLGRRYYSEIKRRL